MNSNDQVPRTVLPIPDQPRVGPTTYDAKDPVTKYPPIEQLRPPAGAPNVLIILIDDAGFGSRSGARCYGATVSLLAIRFTRLAVCLRRPRTA